MNIINIDAAINEAISLEKSLLLIIKYKRGILWKKNKILMLEYQRINNLFLLK